MALYVQAVDEKIVPKGASYLTDFGIYGSNESLFWCDNAFGISQI